MSKRSPRLLFTDEELAAPELKKAIRKADKRISRGTGMPRRSR